jgi:hypothetical protein
MSLVTRDCKITHNKICRRGVSLDKTISSTKQTDDSPSHRHGRALYQTNSTMKDIANVMEHPEFRQFFDKYFQNPQDIQSIIFLMKIYQAIQRNDPYEKISTLYETVSNSQMRKQLACNFIKWAHDKKTNSSENNIPITNTTTHSIRSDYPNSIHDNTQIDSVKHQM